MASSELSSRSRRRNCFNIRRRTSRRWRNRERETGVEDLSGRWLVSLLRRTWTVWIKRVLSSYRDIPGGFRVKHDRRIICSIARLYLGLQGNQPAPGIADRYTQPRSARPPWERVTLGDGRKAGRLRSGQGRWKAAVVVCRVCEARPPGRWPRLRKRDALQNNGIIGGSPSSNRRAIS